MRFALACCCGLLLDCDCYCFATAYGCACSRPESEEREARPESEEREAKPGQSGIVALYAVFIAYKLMCLFHDDGALTRVLCFPRVTFEHLSRLVIKTHIPHESPQSLVLFIGYCTVEKKRAGRKQGPFCLPPYPVSTSTQRQRQLQWPCPPVPGLPLSLGHR